MTAPTPTKDEALGFPIEELELGVKAYNVFKRLGVDTIGELLELDYADVFAWNDAAPYYQRIAQSTLDQAQDAADDALRRLP